MSRSKPWHQVLLDEARRRGIDVSALDVEQLDEASVSEAASWVHQNLVNQQPLTPEELAIWQNIEKSGSRPHRISSQNGSAPIPIDDTSLREAVQELEASTQKVQARSQVLKAQQETRSHLSYRFDGNSRSNVSFEAITRGQQEAEKQQLLFMNNETESELQTAIYHAREKLDKSVRAVKSTVSEKLRADDRTLDSASSSAPSDMLETFLDESIAVTKLDLLKKATVSSLKARLDRVYLQELEAPNSEQGGESTSVEMQRTLSDLQSLYTEIEDVASMVIDYEHGAHLRMMEHEIRSLVANQRNEYTQDVLNKIDSLTTSADQLTKQYSLLQAHRIANNKHHQLYLQAHSENKRHPVEVEHTDNKGLPYGFSSLLRHLNVDDNEGQQDPGLSQRIKEASASVTDGNHSRLYHFIENSRQSAYEARENLDRLASVSSNSFSAAKGESKDLDLHIASTKVRLESSSGAANVEPTARRKHSHKSNAGPVSGPKMLEPSKSSA